MIATNEIIKSFDELADRRREEIRSSPDALSFTGIAYYVSNDGNDENDGLTPIKPWKTLEKVSSAPLNYGDAVLFKRGDLFRGKVMTKSGVSYGAYGSGEKPRLYGFDYDLADEDLWEIYDAENNVRKTILDE